MSFVGRWKVTSGAVAAAAILGVGLSYPAIPAGATPTATGRLAAASGVSPSAAAGTPQLNKVGTGKANQEVIRELVPCGKTMYAVGRFTSIKHGTSSRITSWAAFPLPTLLSWGVPAAALGDTPLAAVKRPVAVGAAPAGTVG